MGGEWLISVWVSNSNTKTSKVLTITPLSIPKNAQRSSWHHWCSLRWQDNLGERGIPTWSSCSRGERHLSQQEIRYQLWNLKHPLTLGTILILYLLRQLAQGNLQWTARLERSPDEADYPDIWQPPELSFQAAKGIRWQLVWHDTVAFGMSETHPHCCHHNLLWSRVR